MWVSYVFTGIAEISLVASVKGLGPISPVLLALGRPASSPLSLGGMEGEELCRFLRPSCALRPAAAQAGFGGSFSCGLSVGG